MKSWKKLEFYISEYLGWKRRGKAHYGDSIWDVEGNGFRGDTKLYAKMRIHTLLEKAEGLYGNNCILITKLKRTHYEPCNVIVHLRLDKFKELLEK